MVIESITGAALGGDCFGPGLGHLWLDVGGLQVCLTCTGQAARCLYSGIRSRRAVRLSRRHGSGPWDFIADLGFAVECVPFRITDAMRGIAN